MNSFVDLASAVLRGALKLALLAFAACVIAGVLLVGLCAALLALIRSLLTGRKPAAWQTFVRFRQTAQHFRTDAWPGSPASSRGSAHPAGDVVDVQAHEVRSALDDQR
jgi:hypothetical protein